VQRCGDLQKLPVSVLGKRFGNPGRRIWLMAQGLDPEPVKPFASEIRSMGHGKVLPPDTRDPEILRVFLMHMAHKLGERLRANHLVARHFLFGLRLYRGWLRTTRRALLPSDDEKVIYQLGEHWLRECWHGQGSWQIRIVALDPGADCQSDLFQRKHPRRQRVHRAMDQVNARYGAMTLASARLLHRSRAPDVISPAWKPDGPRNSL
jgi:DNA polymerase-4